MNTDSVTHLLGNGRLYCSQIVANPQKSLDYVQRNRKKKIVHRKFVTNTYNTSGVGSSFNSLINSCIVHPTGVLLVPFIDSVQISGFGDSHWKSPFDTCPLLPPLLHYDMSTIEFTSCCRYT